MNPWRRVRIGVAAVLLVIGVGTAGYVALGFGLLDALYQTVTTITTVGFREVVEFDAPTKVFTMVLILAGAGTMLFTFSVLLEALVEGHLRQEVGRRRMERKIAELDGHVVVCGWGRVGRALALYLGGAKKDIVVVDMDEDRVRDIPYPTVVGDATDDDVLKAAGIERARALVAALATDAANLYVTLSGRTLRPDLFIVARARNEHSEMKLRRAGADRVVNPQAIGGQRMAAFVLQPHVAEFLDVVMHDGSLEFRVEEVQVPKESVLAGMSIRDAHIRDETGALVLAIRNPAGEFATNPEPSTVIKGGDVLIAIGTADQLARLGRAVNRGSSGF